MLSWYVTLSLNDLSFFLFVIYRGNNQISDDYSPGRQTVLLCLHFTSSSLMAIYVILSIVVIQMRIRYAWDVQLYLFTLKNLLVDTSEQRCQPLYDLYRQIFWCWHDAKITRTPNLNSISKSAEPFWHYELIKIGNLFQCSQFVVYMFFCCLNFLQEKYNLSQLTPMFHFS